MGEEWRLLIELDAEGALAPVANEILAELGGEIGLHRAGDTLVAYADSPELAATAQHRLRGALERHSIGHLESRVEHWDHDSQEWTSGDGESPGSPNVGEPDSHDWSSHEETPASWTVTVSLEHHRAAKQLAEALRAEGYEVSSSWHEVEVLTANRHDAELLVAEVGLRAPGAETEILVGS